MEQSLSAHYALLLGLDDAWKVMEVKLELVEKRVAIRLEHAGGPVVCPECSAACQQHDLAPERTWRHLDTMQFETVLTAGVPRADRDNRDGHVARLHFRGGKELPQAEVVFDCFHVGKHRSRRCAAANTSSS